MVTFHSCVSLPGRVPVRNSENHPCSLETHLPVSGNWSILLHGRVRCLVVKQSHRPNIQQPPETSETIYLRDLNIFGTICMVFNIRGIGLAAILARMVVYIPDQSSCEGHRWNLDTI